MSGHCAVVWTTSAPSQRSLSDVLGWGLLRGVPFPDSHTLHHTYTQTKCDTESNWVRGLWEPNKVIRMRQNSETMQDTTSCGIRKISLTLRRMYFWSCFLPFFLVGDSLGQGGGD